MHLCAITRNFFQTCFTFGDSTILLNLAPLSLIVSTGTYFNLLEMVLKFLYALQELFNYYNGQGLGTFQFQEI